MREADEGVSPTAKEVRPVSLVSVVSEAKE